MKTQEVNGKMYKVSEAGTFYNIETADRVIECIEKCRENRARVRLFWGDTASGKCWNDIYDTTGTISRSMGPVKIPILIHNARSTGGGAILTHCILAIKETGKTGRYLYRASNFVQPAAEITESDLQAEGYTHNVNVYGETQTRHKSHAAAQRMAARFMY